ncbi:hypothetical protein NKR23_g913 [Pleurostoma richardsiae]|uniref:Uncharacterized protein n=1 Tax=Pleurostoma richardsiae TaxID=41990 RepID=A0AA38RTS3_9PEZI|nr:hypothetical protein NKR23_g913 [Pleurostoma richardsiae]
MSDSLQDGSNTSSGARSNSQLLHVPTSTFEADLALKTDTPPKDGPGQEGPLRESGGSEQARDREGEEHTMPLISGRDPGTPEGMSPASSDAIDKHGNSSNRSSPSKEIIASKGSDDSMNSSVFGTIARIFTPSSEEDSFAANTEKDESVGPILPSIEVDDSDDSEKGKWEIFNPDIVWQQPDRREYERFSSPSPSPEPSGSKSPASQVTVISLNREESQSPEPLIEAPLFCQLPEEGDDPKLVAGSEHFNSVFLGSLARFPNPLDRRHHQRQMPEERVQFQADLLAALGHDNVSDATREDMRQKEEALVDWACYVDEEHGASGEPVPFETWRRLRDEQRKGENTALAREMAAISKWRETLAERDEKIRQLLSELRENGSENEKVLKMEAEKAWLERQLKSAQAAYNNLQEKQREYSKTRDDLLDQLQEAKAKAVRAEKTHKAALIELEKRLESDDARGKRAQSQEQLEAAKRISELEKQLADKQEDLLQIEINATRKARIGAAAQAALEEKVEFMSDKIRTLERSNDTPNATRGESSTEDKERIAELEQMLAKYEREKETATTTSKTQLRDVTEQLAASERQIRKLRASGGSRLKTPDGRTILLRNYPSLLSSLIPKRMSDENSGEEGFLPKRDELTEAFFDLKERQNSILRRLLDDEWLAVNPEWDPVLEVDTLIDSLTELESSDAPHFSTSIAALELIKAAIMAKAGQMNEDFHDALKKVADKNKGDPDFLSGLALRLETFALRQNPPL